MGLKLIMIGSTRKGCYQELFSEYCKRIVHYSKFEVIEIPYFKKAKTDTQQKRSEADAFLKYIQPNDLVILLDERGKELSSNHFAEFLNHQMIHQSNAICFLIGGAYGFDSRIYERANQLISLSKMTFPHQLIRINFAEQLYRSFTILNNEPYHH